MPNKLRIIKLIGLQMLLLALFASAHTLIYGSLKKKYEAEYNDRMYNKQSELGQLLLEGSNDRPIYLSKTADDEGQRPVSQAADRLERVKLMSDIISRGDLGQVSWPIRTGSDRSIVDSTAREINNILQLDAERAQQLLESMEETWSVLESALKSKAHVQRLEDKTLITFDDDDTASFKSSYDKMRSDIREAVGPEQDDVLVKLGVLKTLDTKLERMGVGVKTVSITRSPDTSRAIYIGAYMSSQASGGGSGRVRSFTAVGRSALKDILGPISDVIDGDF